MGLIKDCRVGVIPLMDIPAVSGNFGDRVVATYKIQPELLQVVYPGKTAGHTDNGNRLIHVRRLFYRNLFNRGVSNAIVLNR